MKPVKIHPYSDEFVRLFNKEKRKLKKILRGSYKIEHFGSTAIPGMGGKGVIDIMVICEDDVQRKNAVDALIKAGYFLDEASRSRQRIFLSSSEKESDKGDVHLHLTLKNSEESMKPLLFKDYLRLNKDAAQQYAKLKYDLKQLGLSRKEYTKRKQKFIGGVTAIAEYCFKKERAAPKNKQQHL